MSDLDATYAAMLRALGDLQEPTPVDVRLDADPGTAPYGEALVWMSTPGPGCLGTGVWVGPPEQSAAARLVRAASELQDFLAEHVRQTWGEARPPCPGHVHPASPQEWHGEAWWVCPRTTHRLARIGALAGTDPRT